MVDLEDFEISLYKPDKKKYQQVMKLGHYIKDRVVKDAFEFYGEENLEEDYYQLFLCDHKFYTDPPFIQLAIVIASDNDNPIPAPAYKKYVNNKALAPIMQKLFSYPIYGKDDGYTKKEKSMQYSVDCFLKQERLLVFPEGRIAHDGKLARGRFGSAEIAWRTYDMIQQDPELKKKKKGLKIIPADFSYYPMVGMPLKDMNKMTVRFGKSIDFEKEVIKEYNSFKNRFANKKNLERKLKISFMRKVMKEIGSLTTVNIDQVASRLIYSLAKKDYSLMKKEHLESIITDTVKELNSLKPGTIHLIDHLQTIGELKKAYNNLLYRYVKKGILKQDPLYNDMIHFNMDYISSEPDFKNVRNENIILYNHNLVNHLTELKKVVNKKSRNIKKYIS